MHTSLAPVFLVAMLAVVLALAAIIVAFRLRPAKPSGIAVITALSPALVMLALFYSLAVHMHRTLGAWPSSIGERGFPMPLITHAHVAEHCFSILVLFGMFVWPVVLLLCLLVRRWRGCVYYLGLYALSCLLGFGAMLLAPSQFLYWWWD